MTAQVKVLDGGRQNGSDGGGGDQGERLAKLEAILPMLATKGDVSEAKSSVVMWLAGVIAASTAIIISVLAFMLNRTIPLQQPTQAAPIIIYPAAQPQPNTQPKR